MLRASDDYPVPGTGLPGPCAGAECTPPSEVVSEREGVVDFVETAWVIGLVRVTLGPLAVP